MKSQKHVEPHLERALKCFTNKQAAVEMGETPNVFAFDTFVLLLMLHFYERDCEGFKSQWRTKLRKSSQKVSFIFSFRHPLRLCLLY